MEEYKAEGEGVGEVGSEGRRSRAQRVKWESVRRFRSVEVY